LIDWLASAANTSQDALPYSPKLLQTRVAHLLQLVERLVRLIREMGYAPATPAEAREIIGLRPLR
jgi:hypothetical protein